MLWIASRQGDYWLQEEWQARSGPLKRRSVPGYHGYPNSVDNNKCVERTALSATDIAPYAVAQHGLADLEMKHRACIS